MRNKPFLPVAEPNIGQAEVDAVHDAVSSGWVSSMGAYIEKFETGFASFCDVSHGVSVSNGTTAIHLLLVACGIGPGDEVIIPSLTFVATAAAVKHAGATPVFVDCDAITGTMNPEAVAKAVTAKSRAIIVVHLYGHPAEMTHLCEIAKSNNILLFEDAAEAHGAKYRGRVVGGLADAATFSFYGNKVITTGEGGMIVTNNSELEKRLRFLRDHAMDPDKRYWHPEVGYNYRMTNLQAALGTAQLKRIVEITKARQKVLSAYQESDLKSFEIQINPRAEWATPVPWLVCAVFPEAFISRIPKLCEYLRSVGVDTRPYFIPLHKMPPYKECRRVAKDGSSELKCTDILGKRGVNLPSSGNLSIESVNRVVNSIVDFISK